MDAFAGEHQAVDLESDAPDRILNVRQLRREDRDRDWRSVEVRKARLAGDRLRIQTRDGLDAVEVEAPSTRKTFELEFQRYRGDKLETTAGGRHTVTPASALRLRPADWDSIADAEVLLTRLPRAGPPSG